MANENLSSAKAAKNDEFYTQWADIEREMSAYLEYNPDVFRDKTILLPCDDPEWSNFTKFFTLHFEKFGLKKLISTSYAPDSNREGAYYKPTLFDAQQFDESKDMAHGKLFILEPKDISGDGKIDLDDLQWEYLISDGDFRSPEVTKLRDEADIIITNPPFSLFREFVTWIMEGDKQFSVVGSGNAITYKEIFPLIKQNKMWRGRGFKKGDAYFGVPESTRSDYAAGVYDASTQLVHFRNCAWYTNLDHGRRHEPLKLMTMEENIKFHKGLRGHPFHRYDNYNAIEVPFTDAIPSDYTGAMGVPISFLEKYNPDQFEIIGITDRGNEYGLKTREYDPKVTPKASDLNRRAAIKLSDGSLSSTYARLLIRWKVTQ